MENVFTVSGPLLKFAEFLGFFPLDFVGPTRLGSLRVSCRGVFFSCCFLIILLWNFLNAILNNTFSVSDSSVISTVWDIVKNAEFFSYFWLFGYQMWKTRNIKKFLKTLQEFDENVRTSNFC